MKTVYSAFVRADRRSRLCETSLTHGQRPMGAGPSALALAFTLIELLVVITIIAILVAILLPVYGNVTRSKNAAVCLSNLRQLGAASLSYCNDNNGAFPPPNSYPPYTTNSDAPWNKRIYSYLGMASDKEATPLLKCPSDPRKYKVSDTNYARSYTFSSTANFAAGNSTANNGLMQTSGTGGGVYPTRRVSQVSQPSQTLMITEWWTSNAGALRDNWQESYNYSVCAGWVPANVVPTFTDGKTYYHGGGKGLNAVFVDGHAALLTPAELVGNFDNPTASPKISPFTAIR